MTYREAIRMLAKAVLTLSRLVPHTSVEGLAKTVLEELPMPAAPTDDACDPPNDRYEWMDEYDRGYEQARKDLTADGLKAVLHPTVTREQADRVKTALAYYFDAKEFGAMGPNWPAFFRAVADALDREG